VKVIVPATPRGLHERTIPAILEQGHAAVVVPMLEVDSYFELLRELWALGETFAIVEHDVELPGGALEAFEDCPQLWCAHSYEVFAGDIATAYGGPYGLGLSRFRAELLARWPDAVEAAGEMDQHPVHPPRSYAVMDSTLTGALRGRSVPVCQHFPNAVHHHHYNRDGAFLGTPVSG
jgi:hypothetical protein